MKGYMQNLMFMTEPKNWPMGNVLPLKKPVKGQRPAMGYLIADDKGHVEPIVYDIPREQLEGRIQGLFSGNTFELVSAADVPRVGADKLTKTVIETFTNFGALLDAGWIVD